MASRTIMLPTGTLSHQQTPHTNHGDRQVRQMATHMAQHGCLLTLGTGTRDLTVSSPQQDCSLSGSACLPDTETLLLPVPVPVFYPEGN